MYAVQIYDLEIGDVVHREYRNPNTALRAAMATDLSSKYTATPIAFTDLSEHPTSLVPIDELHVLMQSDGIWYRVGMYFEVSGIEQVRIRKRFPTPDYKLIAVEEI